MKSSGGYIGGLWFIGWLFTIGFADLTFWKGVLGVVVWPFYLADKILTLL